MINLKYAPAILTIVQEGSITAASKKLFVSQPALSQTIRQVEEELGAPIFTRDTRHIELTYVGQLYIESVRQIQMIDQNLHARVSDSKGEVFGTFRLGISVQRGLQLLPLVIPDFIDMYPHIRIQLREEGSGMLERRVLEGQCDLGLVTTASKRDQLTYSLIENEQLMLVAATTTELAGRFPDGTPLDIAEAQHECFVSMSEGHSVRAIQDKLFEKYGLSPKILLETHNMEAFTKLMERYEELLDLKDRKEALRDVLDAKATGGNMAFQMNMTDKQLPAIEERIQEIGEITDKQALSLLPSDRTEMMKYLFYTSAKYVQRLNEPKNKELKDIILSDKPSEVVDAFYKYLSDGDNVKKLLRIFPVVATTCISAHRLGEPKPYFDMTIMDEASQCNTAMSLVPIIRGENLMLVGDPQQLNPVILLDSTDNEYLRKRYIVSDEYDYISNSIYKTFLACDSVSDEILLRSHYRCAKKIIEFNNRKYYNNKLEIKSQPGVLAESLVYKNVEDNYAGDRNTAPKEAAVVVQYVEEHPDQKIGIITPFVNQKELIAKELKAHGLEENVTCGTVHAFQGDEKDVILFSLALTDQTSEKTYGWLKNNKELINVATSRARDQLVVVSNDDALDRLRTPGEDDLYELVDYVRSNGETHITSVGAASRALGIKPYSSKTEEAFLMNLNHAMSNIFLSGRKCSIKKEVPISQVFQENIDEYNSLFYTGRFDFVVYEKVGRQEYPILAIELDGKEHLDDEVVRRRDAKKNQICESHGFQLIRVENSYARRYNYIKDILSTYFDGRNKAVKVQVKRK